MQFMDFGIKPFTAKCQVTLHQSNSITYLFSSWFMCQYCPQYVLYIETVWYAFGLHFGVKADSITTDSTHLRQLII